MSSSTTNPTSPAQSGEVQLVHMDNTTEITQGSTQPAVSNAIVGEMQQITPSPTQRSFYDETMARLYHDAERYMQNAIQPSRSVSSIEVPTTPSNLMPVSTQRVKIRKKVQPKTIAKKIARYSKEKIVQTAKQAATLVATIEADKKNIEIVRGELVKKQNRLKFFEKQAERITKKQKELEQLFLEELQQISKMKGVDSITIDTKNRIIVTTTPLLVKKPYWKKARRAGRYQIRIDFSEQNIEQGIRVLNIDKVADVYDSPTILNTKCCWGNAKNDVQNDFLTQNLPELVTDMLEYITSPHEQNGYLGLDGDKTKGWEEWFRKPQKRPENYSWEMREDASTPTVTIDRNAINEYIQAIPDTSPWVYRSGGYDYRRVTPVGNDLVTFGGASNMLQSPSLPHPQGRELEEYLLRVGLTTGGVGRAIQTLNDSPLPFNQLELREITPEIFELRGQSIHGNSIVVALNRLELSEATLAQLTNPRERRVVTFRTPMTATETMQGLDRAIPTGSSIQVQNVGEIGAGVRGELYSIAVDEAVNYDHIVSGPEPTDPGQPGGLA